jgi:hypothetical protein
MLASNVFGCLTGDSIELAVVWSGESRLDDEADAFEV